MASKKVKVNFGVLNFLVVNSANEHLAAVKYAEDAAALVAVVGCKVLHIDEQGNVGKVLWDNAVDGNAGESYDAASDKMHERMTG